MKNISDTNQNSFTALLTVTFHVSENGVAVPSTVQNWIGIDSSRVIVGIPVNHAATADAHLPGE
jgi:hypothetical protein